MTINAYTLAANNSETDPFFNYFWSEMMPTLNKTTVQTLQYPQIVGAKISYDADQQTGILLFVSWVESLPSIDGICIHLPSESFIVQFIHKPDVDEYGYVFFMHGQNISKTDAQWDKLIQTINLLKIQPIYVSLVQGKKILDEKFELKHLPFPKRLSVDMPTSREISQ